MAMSCTDTPAQDSDNSASANTLVTLSQDFLYDLKDGNSGEEYIHQLAQITLEDLELNLNTKAEKLTFWVNIYNALVQYRLLQEPSLFDDRSEFFTRAWLDIAGIRMSYDDIEHGIIRNSRVKLGLGYLKNLTAPYWQKKLRNTDIDGRVHFVLNCGAKSCPFIPILSDQNFDDRLDTLAKNYLSKITEVNGSQVRTSPLFSWFRGDFGGKRGVKKLLLTYGLIESVSDCHLEYLPYDWTLETGNYTTI